jgi:hypothetical protein
VAHQHVIPAHDHAGHRDGISLMLLLCFVKPAHGILEPRPWRTSCSTRRNVLFSVLPKLKQMNPNMYEARGWIWARGPLNGHHEGHHPEISQGIVTGALLSFTMSHRRLHHQLLHRRHAPRLSMIVSLGQARGFLPSMYALSWRSCSW